MPRKSSNKTVNLAHTLIDLARQQYARKAARQEALLSERLKRSGKYVEYDSRRGVHRVKLLDGSIRSARSISNGGMRPGEPVSFVQPLGARLGTIKGMPR